MRTRILGIVGLLVVAFFTGTSAGTSASAATAAATPYCGIYWGSLTKSHAATSVAPMTNVRAGRHDCYDRLVVDVRAPGANGYRVSYREFDGGHDPEYSCDDLSLALPWALPRD